MSFDFLSTTTSPTTTRTSLGQQMLRSSLSRRYSRMNQNEFLSDEESELESELRATTNYHTGVNKHNLHNSTNVWGIIPSENDHDQNNSISNSKQYNSSTFNDDNTVENSDSDEDEDTLTDEGREIVGTLDLCAPASFSSPRSSPAPGSQRAVATQGHSNAKRLRLDASATVHSNTTCVRFDETKNTEYPPMEYPDESPFLTSSPILAAQTYSNTRMWSPTLSSSRNTLSSSRNTPQDFMDIAASISSFIESRTGNESPVGPPFTQVPCGSPVGSPRSSPCSSPQLLFGFQEAPLSPRRPSYLSAYSPPLGSSLSSSWSPSLESEREDCFLATERTSCPSPSPSPLPLPSESRALPQRHSASASFSPRRPRNSSPLGSGNWQELEPSAEPFNESSNSRPRFPSMLKRELSNHSFLENYPLNLTPEESQQPKTTSPSTSKGRFKPRAPIRRGNLQRPPAFQRQLTFMGDLPGSLSSSSPPPPPDLSQDDGDLEESHSPYSPASQGQDHAAIASVVLNNTPSLTKSMSDTSYNRAGCANDNNNNHASDSDIFPKNGKLSFSCSSLQQQQEQQTQQLKRSASWSYGLGGAEASAPAPHSSNFFF